MWKNKNGQNNAELVWHTKLNILYKLFAGYPPLFILKDKYCVYRVFMMPMSSIIITPLLVWLN